MRPPDVRGPAPRAIGHALSAMRHFFSVGWMEQAAEGMERNAVWVTDNPAPGKNGVQFVDASSTEVYPCDSEELRNSAKAEVMPEGFRRRRMLGGKWEDCVMRGDMFEMRVIGFCVPRFDMPFISEKNELVLSSQGERGKPPKIHFHYDRDRPTVANKYHAVLDRYGLMTRCCGQSDVDKVSVNFKIVEIDKVSKEMRQTIDSVEELTKGIQSIPGVSQYAAALTPVLDLAGNLGDQVLKSYAKEDHVISKDEPYKLLGRADASVQPRGYYLKYGYYFFLQKPTKMKLYVQMDGTREMRLMTKTTKGKYKPLRKISYVAVQVTEPSKDVLSPNVWMQKCDELGEKLQLESAGTEIGDNSVRRSRALPSPVRAGNTSAMSLSLGSATAIMTSSGSTLDKFAREEWAKRGCTCGTHED